LFNSNICFFPGRLGFNPKRIGGAIMADQETIEKVILALFMGADNPLSLTDVRREIKGKYTGPGIIRAITNLRLRGMIEPANEDRRGSFTRFVYFAKDK
jgi:hypothetical protein